MRSIMTFILFGSPQSMLRMSVALIASMYLAGFSHAQIGKYERVKKLNKETYNFHGDEEPENLKKNKDYYIVFSDRSENTTFGDAYAQKRNPAQPFLKPFFVLDEKNDYLELVTYDPSLLGKPDGMLSVLYRGKYTFSDSKSAEYIGWIHKNRLLHYSQAETSHLNYRPVRYVLGIRKLSTLFNVDKFIVDEQVKLYMDPDFKRESDKKLKLNQIVYLYKENERQTAVLVSNQSQISDADSAERIMGWVSKDLLNYVGQHQVFSTDSLDSIVFYQPSYLRQKIALSRKEIGSSIIFNTEKNTPMNVREEDTVDVMVPTSVWDHSQNTLTNVEGDELLISKIEEIEKQSKHINFHFIFDSSDEAKLKQIKLMASLQRIWLQYAENEEYSDYKFTFSTSSYGTNEFYFYRPTTSFPDWIEYINKVLLSDPSAYRTMVNDVGIERCFNLVLASSDSIDFSTNIVMVSGMKAFTRMSAKTKSHLTKRLAQVSSRLVFFQLANSSEDAYQEFILQSKDLLGRVALEYADFIKSFTVDNHLVKEKNIFKSIPSEDNLYVYDSPEASNYQGGIGFSKMNSELVPTSVDLVLDSVIAHTLKTNKIYLESLDEYNSKLGFLRSRPSRYIAKIVDQDSTYQDQINLLPRNSLDETYNRYDRVRISENDLVTAYLLSEAELQLLIDNYKSLIPLFSNEVTKKDRKFVYNIYTENIKNLNELFLNEVLSTKSTIADLIFIKSGLPVANETLHELKVKNVTSRRRLDHASFHSLLLNLRKKIDELEIIYASDERMTTDYDATTRYYFIPVEKLF